MYELELRDICKAFGKNVALDNITLKEKTGEFLSILGPSGCGKTTALRIIAGFVRPDRGNVVIQGKDVTDVPPRSRNIGMVFQNYALFPHMTVFENLSFGLKVEKIDKKTIIKKVEESLAVVELIGFETRYPKQLSGGQQQRVAFARALIKNPKILLMDEPLSNLDAKLRQQMRNELRSIQKKLGITAVYVTHDQEEAISMSDRVVVMEKGRIIQIGTPMEIYENPVNTFVADFIGQTNIIRGEVVSAENETIELRLSDNVSISLSENFLKYQGKKVTCSVRPDRIHISKNHSESHNYEFPTKVLSKVYMGPISSYIVSVMDEINLNVIQQSNRNGDIIDEGQTLYINLDPENLVFIDDK